MQKKINFDSLNLEKSDPLTEGVIGNKSKTLITQANIYMYIHVTEKTNVTGCMIDSQTKETLATNIR